MAQALRATGILPQLALDKFAPGSPTVRLAAGAAVLWLVLAAGVAVLLVREREVTVERTGRNLAALALALEAHTARTFQAVDLTLAGAVDALRLADDLPPHDPEFQAALERRLEFLGSYVRAIYIVNGEGAVVHDTDYPEGPVLRPASQDYFQVHRNDRSLIAAVSPPVEHPRLGRYVPVTRRLGSESGFAGIAVAAVQPRYFESLYRRLGLGATDVISLYYRNGMLISRYPDAERATGSSFADSALFAQRLPDASAGTFTVDDPAGVRLVSYRDVEGQPLVVAVTQDLRTVLAPWRAEVVGAALALGGFIVLLALLVDQLRRQQRVRERAQEQHARTERLRALGHLTSGIAHDFNNLLGVVSSSLAIIAQYPAEGAARRQALAAAERAVARGSELIRRLATFARSRPIELTVARLDECITESEELLKRAAGRHVDLLIDVTPDLPPCRLDRTEFEIALVNLVVNARDAMAGSGRIAIRSYSNGDTQVCVSIEDTGHGMSDSVQQHAFEPYYTTKGDRGTGLGLSQVYGFMLQAGGEARIVSRPGLGTRVELCFPITQAAGDDVAESARNES